MPLFDDEDDDALPRGEDDTFPVVGMGGTITVGSDRYPCTIIAVNTSGRQVQVQRDQTRWSSGDTPDDSRCVFLLDPKGEIETYSLRRDGSWRRKGLKITRGWWLTIGSRDSYMDPSF